MEQRAPFVPVAAEYAATGEILLTGPTPRLRPFDAVGDMLRAAVARAPDRTFLIETSDEGEIRLTYGEALRGAEARARALIDAGLNAEQPLAILSGNSIEHALMALGAMLARVPVAPISVPYSQIDDLSRLHAVFDCLKPGLVWADSGAVFDRALDHAQKQGLRTGSADTGINGGLTEPSGAVPLPQVMPDDIGKILFTSGSTGVPKGVITTHRMMCSDQEAIAECWPFLLDEPPVVVDWLPWNHCFGGSLVFNCVLRHAGTLVIDHGRPLPGLFAPTLRNLAEYPPTVHFGVPLGFTELVPHLEANEQFARRYFSRLQRMFTAGAALPAPIWESYLAVAKEYAKPSFHAHVSWGATETSPVVTLSPEGNRLPDNLGVPVPGCEVKLVPNEDKMELRLRGPMVTPGYWRRPDLTSEAFDSEGFYRIGDAGLLLTEDDKIVGIRFDGRTAENFKLVNGTWVQVGPLRLALVGAARPVVRDAVITGQDRNEVGALIFLALDGAREVSGLPDAGLEELSRNGTVRTWICEKLGAMGGTASTRIRRVLILADQPSLASGEMTDKGYVNQRAALRQRADDVERLYSASPDAEVIFPR